MIKNETKKVVFYKGVYNNSNTNKNKKNKRKGMKMKNNCISIIKSSSKLKKEIEKNQKLIDKVIGDDPVKFSTKIKKQMERDEQIARELQRIGEQMVMSVIQQAARESKAYPPKLISKP